MVLNTNQNLERKMSNIFSKGCFSVPLALMALGVMASPIMAEDCCDPCDDSRIYLGAFGGGLYSNSNRISQFGTAYFPERHSIGPLSVIGEGHLRKTSTGFGGVQLGYEWSKRACADWSFAPAGELEVFFYKHKRKGHLINETVNGLPEHDFANSFHTNTTVIMANGLVSINNDCLCGFIPYVGGGIGAARISLHNANSVQVDPFEAGVNHFNSRRNDSSWAFAAQAKAGVRYNFSEMFSVFAEYRYLYVDANNYVFGATNYRTHVPTSPWNVKVRDVHYNAFAIGLQVNL
jgi:opacity protein-like surface antigen